MTICQLDMVSELRYDIIYSQFCLIFVTFECYNYNLHSALVLTHFGIFTTNPCHERIRTG